MIDPQAKITIPKEVLFRELNGETVILNLDNGKYFGLNEIGSRIWALLNEYGNLADVYQVLLSEYDVQAQRLRDDLTQLIDELVSFGLVQIDEQ